MRRIVLFMAVNILMVVTISLVLGILGVGPYMTQYGIDYQALAVFCLIWGMGGAFISLWMSKLMAKWMMRVKIIDPNTPDSTLQNLVATVHRLAKAANLPKMPEVGIYDSPEVNAFATGPSRSNSLVAVSSGLLRSMNQREVEGVLAHEVAHVANGDMVTLTLIQGVLNAFVMFFARILAFAASQFLRGNDEENPSFFVQMGLTIAFELLFGFLAMFVVAYFSRIREFKADAGGAKLAGRDKMTEALRRLQQNVDRVDSSQPAVAAMKISGKKAGIMALLSTHPPLEKRIRKLQGTY